MRAAAMVALLAGGGAPASAHPHVWITATSDLVFDEARRFVAIRHTWTFDEAYSAYMTINLDSRHDGVPDPGKLAELAATNLASIAESGFFTTAKVNGKPVTFGPAQAESQTFSGGRLHLSFDLPVRAPVLAPRILVVTIDDPSFFVAFSFAPGSDPIRLAGPKTGCALNVNRAAQVAEEGKQLVPDDIAATAAPDVGAGYASRVLVACP